MSQPIVPNPLYAAVITAGPDYDLDGQTRQHTTQASGDLMGARDAINNAQEQYGKAAAFYDGEVGEVFATLQVKQLLAKAGIAEVENFNYAAVPVDVVADRLQIAAIHASAGTEATDETTLPGGVETDEHRDVVGEKAKELIGQIQKRNQLGAESKGLHRLASQFGDVYLFCWPVTEDDGETDDAADSEPDRVGSGRVVAVDALVNDPRTCRVFYDPQNPLVKSHAAKYWCEPDPRSDAVDERHRITLYYPDRVEKWCTRVGGRPDNAADWQPFTGDGEVEQDWSLPNPTGVVPFYHFRNDRPYGKPEHLRAYGPQRMVNKLIGAHAVTIDYQSFPQRYALLDPKADQLLSNRIDPDFPEDDDDDPEAPGAHSGDLRADPAAVWRIPGVSSMGQFQPADPGIFITPMDRYVRAMAELTATPLHRFGSAFAAAPSGESLRVAEGPTTSKIEDRQEAYGEVWSEFYEFALHLLGLDDITVTVRWKPAETATGTEDWTTLGLKIANGVPVKHALMEAGYPEDTVEEWLADESGADLVRRVAILNSIGTAVQALGAGVGLGVVSEQQVGDIIARVLGMSAVDLPPLDEPVQLHQPAAPPAPGGPPTGPAGPPPGQGAAGGTQAQPALPPLPAPPAAAPAPPILVGVD